MWENKPDNYEGIAGSANTYKKKENVGSANTYKENENFGSANTYKKDEPSKEPSNERKQELLKIIDLLKLLREGKKVRVNMNYVYPDVPMLKIECTDTNRTTDIIDLDCIPTREYETYLVEKSLNYVDSVSICGYKSNNFSKIEYIYCNPQMNRMFAKLADGNEVDWDFNIIDVWHAYVGEYVEPITVIIQFWDNKNQGEMIPVSSTTREISSYLSVDEAIKEIIDLELEQLGCDMIILFPDGTAKHVPAKDRKV